MRKINKNRKVILHKEYEGFIVFEISLHLLQNNRYALSGETTQMFAMFKIISDAG